MTLKDDAQKGLRKVSFVHREPTMLEETMLSGDVQTTLKATAKRTVAPMCPGTCDKRPDWLPTSDEARRFGTCT